ncbi:MAG: septum formation protein Maf [Deltaproteobacteria bacterium]|nr:septum formation protein Maf [Deltaproteobacteria bacterium]
MIILASASPRRKELLELVDVKFIVDPADIDESAVANENAERMVKRLAMTKAQVCAHRHPSKFVLAADTVVVLPEEKDQPEQILGKPVDENDARRMLNLLHGRKHCVISAYALCCLEKQVALVKAVSADVHFRVMTSDEIDAYILTKEPMDKAGAYGVQGKGAAFISQVKGSYSNVVGLPLCEVLEDLKALGLWSTGSFTRVNED